MKRPSPLTTSLICIILYLAGAINVNAQKAMVKQITKAVTSAAVSFVTEEVTEEALNRFFNSNNPDSPKYNNRYSGRNNTINVRIVNPYQYNVILTVTEDGINWNKYIIYPGYYVDLQTQYYPVIGIYYQVGYNYAYYIVNRSGTYY